jgi:hypothetical protein
MITGMADQEISVEQGYQNLLILVKNNLKDLLTITVEPGSVVAIEDALFMPAPLYRGFQLCTKQPLASALDHLQLVGETLNHKGEPHAFAESSLIRTAITAASYSLWLLLPNDQPERRFRALQFIFKDCDGFTGFLRTYRNDPAGTKDDRADAEKVLGGLGKRREWIVEQANTLRGETKTVREFRKALPSDTDVIEQAAGVRVLARWRWLSGYAHGLLWSTLGNQVPESGPDPGTGAFTMIQKGNPKELLDAAFDTLQVIEIAINRLRILCAVPT